MFFSTQHNRAGSVDIQTITIFPTRRDLDEFQKDYDLRFPKGIYHLQKQHGETLDDEVQRVDSYNAVERVHHASYSFIARKISTGGWAPSVIVYKVFSSSDNIDTRKTAHLIPDHEAMEPIAFKTSGECFNYCLAMLLKHLADTLMTDLNAVLPPEPVASDRDWF